MPRDLPSLNSLHVFECAARHRNFTKASEELFVTQAAVSRQIRKLEDYLNQPLFHRDGPRVELTEVGEHYFSVVEQALGIVRRGTREVLRFSNAPTITVSVLPSFATNWLVENAAHFRRENPDLELRLEPSYEPVDFDRSVDIDVAIRFGEGNWPHLFHECLLHDQMFPVCSPELLGQRDSITAEELAEFPLICAADPYDEWARWFQAQQVEPPSLDSYPRYIDLLLLYKAAIQGQGVALARSLLVETELRTGRLVRASDVSIQARHNYYFVCPIGQEKEEKTHRFLVWLRERVGS